MWWGVECDSLPLLFLYFSYNTHKHTVRHVAEEDSNKDLSLMWLKKKKIHTTLSPPVQVRLELY